MHYYYLAESGHGSRDADGGRCDGCEECRRGTLQLACLELVIDVEEEDAKEVDNKEKDTEEGHMEGDMEEGHMERDVEEGHMKWDVEEDDMEFDVGS